MILATEAYSREVTFEWEPLEGAISYQIEVSKTPKFSKEVLKQDLEHPTLTTDLQFGQYYYRVRALDKDKKYGHWSDPEKILIAPYPPELKDPKASFSTSYYEILPKISFSWKPLDGNPEYEIFIYKTTGKKALEIKVKGTEFSTQDLPEGEYMWKVRSIYDQTIESPYCEPRGFVVEKKTLETPKNISPEKDGTVSAFRQVDFQWSKDKAAKFTDLSLKIPENQPKPPEQKNVETETASIEYLEPGDFEWSVTTKEGKETPGIKSEVTKFKVRDDLISDDNYGFQFGYGYGTMANSFVTSRLGSQQTGENKSTSIAQHLSGYYFFNRGFGIALGLKNNSDSSGSYDIPDRQMTATMRLRFGAPGFNQQFLFGFRSQNVYELIASPATTFNRFSLSGPVVGTYMTGTISQNWKVQFGGFYFGGTSHAESKGQLQADYYEGMIQVGRKLFYKMWAHYTFTYGRGVYNFIPNSSSTSTSWNTTAMEPFRLSISLEH